jgi:hypothetical protein
MRRALRDDVPDGMTLLFTVTAPIRALHRERPAKRRPNICGFVHNPDVDVKALFDEWVFAAAQGSRNHGPKPF